MWFACAAFSNDKSHEGTSSLSCWEGELLSNRNVVLELGRKAVFESGSEGIDWEGKEFLKGRIDWEGKGAAQTPSLLRRIESFKS